MNLLMNNFMNVLNLLMNNLMNVQNAAESVDEYFDKCAECC